MDSYGRSFVSAIATRDPDALKASLSPAVDFRGLTPRKFWQADTDEGVVDAVFGHWFTDTDRVLHAEVFGEDVVVDTRRIGYRLILSLPSGRHVVEQQAYCRADASGITYLRILCSGFRPLT